MKAGGRVQVRSGRCVVAGRWRDKSLLFDLRQGLGCAISPGYL